MKEKSKKKEKFTCPLVFCFFLRVLDGTLHPLCQVFYSKIKKAKKKRDQQTGNSWEKSGPHIFPRSKDEVSHF